MNENGPAHKITDRPLDYEPTSDTLTQPSPEGRGLYDRNRSRIAINSALRGYFFIPSTLHIPAPRVAMNRKMKQ